MTKSEAARLGGQALYKKYGSEYMSDLGRKGAVEFWKLYNLQPVQFTRYAIVERSTGKIIRVLGAGFTRKG